MSYLAQSFHLGVTAAFFPGNWTPRLWAKWWTHLKRGSHVTTGCTWLGAVLDGGTSVTYSVLRLAFCWARESIPSRVPLLSLLILWLSPFTPQKTMASLVLHSFSGVIWGALSSFRCHLCLCLQPTIPDGGRHKLHLPVFDQKYENNSLLHKDVIFSQRIRF